MAYYRGLIYDPLNHLSELLLLEFENLVFRRLGVFATLNQFDIVDIVDLRNDDILLEVRSLNNDGLSHLYLLHHL